MSLQKKTLKIIRTGLYKDQYIKSFSNQCMELFKKAPVKSLKEILDAMVTTPIISTRAFLCRF